MSPRPRVAVVGAGAAGLATVKALLEVGAEVTAFETGDRPGGLWVRDNASGRSAAYASLHLNTSRGRTQFADHPMPAEWPDYPSADLVAGYLADYARTFGLLEHIRFGTSVTAVQRTEVGWTVDTDAGGPGVSGSGSSGTASSGSASSGSASSGSASSGSGSSGISSFDAVVVANGHNWDPRWPSPAYPGTFDGVQMHAHDYRTPDVFRDRRVMVVGMGNSAMDIAVDASYLSSGPVLLSARHGVHVVPKYLFGRPADATGAALTRLPWRTRQRVAETMLRLAVGRPEAYGLPAPAGGLFQNHPTISDTILHRLTHGEVVARPGIERLDGTHVVFTDGRREQVDTIVWATGYRVSVPFLDERWLHPDAEAMPLYRRVFHLEDPSLMFVGLMQSTGAALPVVEAQARLAAAWLSGRYALPDPAQQRRATATALSAARDRWGDKRPAMRIDFDDYVADIPRELAAGTRRLAARTGVTFLPPGTDRSEVPA